MTPLRPLRARRFVARLARDHSALALVEFALSLPLVLTLGLYGVETSNLALANLRMSQLALNLADNASRVGAMQNNNKTQLREIDINDVLSAAKQQGDPWNFTTRGRVILSSLEGQGNKQVIHWQRCLGTMGQLAADSVYNSSYGITATNNQSTGTTYDPTAGINTSTSSDNAASHPGSIAAGGMGDPGAQVTAPDGSGVMFVEVNYLYNPVVGAAWLAGGATRIHYIASFIVRDNRVFDELYNPSPAAPRATCDKYTADVPTS